MLSLLLLLLSQTQVPEASPLMDRPVRTRDMLRAGGRSGVGLAFFEFAPASGLGMGSACACTTPTGARGEALTFTRASTGTCTKGNTSTGIANGDLVSCGNNLPRVMPGGDGTGALGLLVESTRTNVVLRSQEIDNVAWADFTGGGAAAPTLNGADNTTAPDGTVTAEAYTFPATSAAQGSGRSQAPLTAVAYSGSVYIKGQSGSGTMDLCIQTGTATCTACSYVNTSWTRCLLQGVTSVAAGSIYIGNLSVLNGGTARSANAVYLWGAQAEAGAYVTSYIPTAGAGVVRSDELAYFDLVSGGPQGSASVAVTVEAPATSAGSRNVFALNASTAIDTSGINSLWAYSGGSPGFVRCYYGGAAAGFVAVTGGTHRIWCASVASTSLNGAFDVTSMSAGGAPGAAAAIRYISIGGVAGVFNWDSVSKQFCLDPSPSRCR